MEFRELLAETVKKISEENSSKFKQACRVPRVHVLIVPDLEFPESEAVDSIQTPFLVCIIENPGTDQEAVKKLGIKPMEKKS